ncbi:hypothetical protein RJ639_045124 [Escallonia herrerae]|uniref:Integrase catalytic domain-containing protein n=1 Tax=Escallonia herrerae TaxID=1293975 RepID=A0AA89AZX9_9ASTE|nr:hypothetical protein RJ639_045124 [Escallonia herrerae]
MAFEAWTSKFWRSEIAIDEEYGKGIAIDRSARQTLQRLSCRGKQHRHSFPKESISRAKAPLELIHIDVCGPIDPTSLGKHIYFLLFIDDYSRKTCVYFLKQNSEVFSTFKRFKALVKKQRGYQIKAMISNKGGEFTSKEFKQRKELDNKSEKFIFIDYSQESKGYKLYNPVDKKMKVSRDVTFDEKSSWDWTNRDKEQYIFYSIDMNRKEVEEESIELVTPSSNNVKIFDDFKKDMAKEFEMTDIDLISIHMDTKEVTDSDSIKASISIHGIISSVRALRRRKSRILLGRCHPTRTECSDGILFGQNSARPLSLCSGKVFGRNSVRTEFCSAIVTLLGQSVRTGFCSDRILSLCTGKVFGRNSVLTELCSAVVTLLGQSVQTGFCSDRILLDVTLLGQSVRTGFCSDRIMLGQILGTLHVSPSGETVMPSDAGDAAASHLPGEGPSGDAPEP